MDENMINSFISMIRDILILSDDELKETAPTIKEIYETNAEVTINSILSSLESQNMTKQEAREAMNAFIDYLTHLVETQENMTETKLAFIKENIIQPVSDIMQTAVDKYHSYNIKLPIKLDYGATMPTYAHESDAAADLYALEDQVLGARTYGNRVHTGVSIQLPEGWMAFIFPRSSIGAKTPLRLSNSAGIIDSGYRGELGVLYDNFSNDDYTIHKGDRIAQLLVMPSYRFLPKQVDILETSDRGAAGFGSTGT